MVSLKNSCDGVNNSLDVRFTKACRNNCEYCIDKVGLDCLGKTNVKEMIKETNKQEVADILILGGEPFIESKKLLQYIKGIQKEGRKIYITTSLPEECNVSNPIFLKIMDIVDGINVSFNSTDNVLNNKIFNGEKINRLKVLKAINKKYTDKVRVNLNLVKGVIDSMEDVRKSLEDLNNAGCKEVKFNELQHSSDLYVSFEKIMEWKLGSPYATGCQTHIGVYKDIRTVMLKRACFIVEESLKANFQDFMKVLYKKIFWTKRQGSKVLYENGVISEGWIKKGELGNVDKTM